MEKEKNETSEGVIGEGKGESKLGYYPLRFRSTGLGKTMLQGEPADIQIVEDMLVMHIQSTTPVRWRIRAALTFRGFLMMLKMALKPSVLKFILRGFTTLRNPKLTDEF